MPPASHPAQRHSAPPAHTTRALLWPSLYDVASAVSVQCCSRNPPPRAPQPCMALMLPEGGEVMRRVACADVCPAPPAPTPPVADPNRHARNTPPQNKELLRRQLLAASARDAGGAESVGDPSRAKHTRTRQKNRWKLKFHHQALPQEYLDHYEQSLQREQGARKRIDTASPQRRTPNPSPSAPTQIQPYDSGVPFDVWAQRLADDTGGATAAGTKPDVDRRKRPPAPPVAPAKVVTYDDLPYMGEITLNHAKPRRGRKPKKADICHLIYENYGTVVPGQPLPDPGPARPPSAPAHPHTVRADLQNRIISSLLERKRRRPPPENEPLNLCIRDLHELRIQVQQKVGDAHPALPATSDAEQPNAISVIQRNTNLPSPSGSPDADSSRVSPALSEPARCSPIAGVHGEAGLAAGYVYWPSAGVYMHPLALQTQLLYYQRLAAAARGEPLVDSHESDISPTGENVAVGLTPTVSSDDVGTKLVLKQISELLDPTLIARPTTVCGGTKRVSPQPGAGAGVRGPTKRKRSAIFIPPMPARSSSTTPTAEVSICKFKFTGGSKPSLQEKKMLSVDAGGNFRYYSGASGKSKATDGQPRRPALVEPVPPDPEPVAERPRSPDDGEGRRKRRSRKSLQRERLERTFKEKGFLIQTQQLQSAEGATYCKFRQLRKFTRYLFRSWKDYLPGELHERNVDAPTVPAPAVEPRPPDWT